MYSRSPNLALTCQRIRSACSSAPDTVKAEYLFCCWLDSYAERFKAGSYIHGLPSIFFSQFLPTSFPPSGKRLELRSQATCDVISYVTRFGLCSPKVLSLFESKMIHMKLCGNIVQLHGIFYQVPKGLAVLVPVHIACHEVPCRLFKTPLSLKAFEDSKPDKLHERLLCDSIMGHLNAMVPSRLQGGNCTLPPWPHLELCLRLILIHQASPNSYRGYPLAMCVHNQNLVLICFLLAVGADPAMKKGIALQLAVKKNLKPLLKFLIERDDVVESKWQIHLRAITQDLRSLSAARASGRVIEPAPFTGTPSMVSSKRRRLDDRCAVDISLLQAAVQARAWELVTYLMHGKGLVPDVDTLELMDRCGMP